MKTLMILGFALSITVQAQSIVEYNGDINLCAPDAQGCLHSINIDGEMVTVDLRSFKHEDLLDPSGRLNFNGHGIVLEKFINNKEEKIFKPIYSGEGEINLCEHEKGRRANCRNSIRLLGKQSPLSMGLLSMDKETYISNDQVFRVTGYYTENDNAYGDHGQLFQIISVEVISSFESDNSSRDLSPSGPVESFRKHNTVSHESKAGI